MVLTTGSLSLLTGSPRYRDLSEMDRDPSYDTRPPALRDSAMGFSRNVHFRKSFLYILNTSGGKKKTCGKKNLCYLCVDHTWYGRFLTIFVSVLLCVNVSLVQDFIGLLG